MDHYLARYDEFSDIQEARPRPLSELEAWTPPLHGQEWSVGAVTCRTPADAGR